MSGGGRFVELDNAINSLTSNIDEVNSNLSGRIDTVKNRADNCLPKSMISNSAGITVAGYGLDARQNNPTIDGSLANSISRRNGKIVIGTVSTSVCVPVTKEEVEVCRTSAVDLTGIYLVYYRIYCSTNILHFIIKASSNLSGYLTVMEGANGMDIVSLAKGDQVVLFASNRLNAHDVYIGETGNSRISAIQLR